MRWVWLYELDNGIETFKLSAFLRKISREPHTRKKETNRCFMKKMIRKMFRMDKIK